MFDCARNFMATVTHMYLYGVGMPFPGTYMTLYNASAHAVKSVDAQLKVVRDPYIYR